MINGDNALWIDNTIKHDLLITDGLVIVSGKNYSVSGATVTITNDILESQAFELDQSLCSQAQIQFGSCESASIKFTIHENIPSVKDKVLKVYIIPDSDASEMVQIGVFKVDKDELLADRIRRTITCYDAMYDILSADVAAWYNTELPNSSSTKTLLQFRADFLSHFNITAESIVLPNDGITIKRTIEPESLSGADVIKAICEINGCFGQITNEGKFRFVILTPGLDDGLFPSDTLYPADDLYPQDVNHDVTVIDKAYYITANFEDYNSESITGLTIRQDDEDAGISIGTNNNRYVIVGNFLVFGYNSTQLTSVANAAFGNMENRYYKPCKKIDAVGNPLHEVGDGIRIRTQYRGIVTYILERKLTGIQTLKDTYAAQGEQYFNQQLNSVSSQFKQLEGRTSSLKVETNRIEAKVEYELDSTKQGSYAYMTEQEIGLKVTRTEIVNDLNTEIGSGITIGTNYIHVNSSGEFTVDASNFKLDENGDCTLGSVSFTGGEIQMVEGSGLNLYHNGIQVTTDSNNRKWLNISGYNSGQGSSEFTNVAINGATIHIGYDQGDTSIYHCDRIYARTSASDAYIQLEDLNYGSGLRIQGRMDSRIMIDANDPSYEPNGIVLKGDDLVLDGDNITVGVNNSDVVIIKGRTCKWKNVTVDGTTYSFLVEDA